MALFNKRFLEGIAERDRKIQESLAQESRSYRTVLGSYSASNINQKFDIFLSHSSIDKIAVGGLARHLEKTYHLSTYVDWINDPQLDRSNVTKETAEIIKMRMSNSRCLFYVTSLNAPKSKWMPWELGIMDALVGKVAICPLSEEYSNSDSYNGQEYLGLYPYVSEKKYISYNPILWIHNDLSKPITFHKWIE